MIFEEPKKVDLSTKTGAHRLKRYLQAKYPNNIFWVVCEHELWGVRSNMINGTSNFDANENNERKTK